MNKGKRRLELASGIVAIVFGSFMTFSGLISLGTLDLMYELYPEFAEMKAYLITVIIILILLNIAVIIVGAFMCPSGFKDGKKKSKLGCVITMIVLAALNFLLNLDSGFMALGYLASLILAAISLFLKHENINFVYPKMNYSAVSQQPTTSIDVSEELIKEATNEEVKEPEVVNKDVVNENVIHENKNAVPTAKYVENVSINDIETQLLKLKELKDKEVIDEAQYKDAVSKLLSKL